ncbi:MAG: hypothetical protein Q9177_005413, partial [Variospora cf. flavescens]
LTPAYTDGGTITTKMAGVVLASLSSGAGELSFLGLTHYYGPFSLAAWGSGTGGAGLIGAGAYAIATTTVGMSVKASLLASASLPIVMLFSFFVVLPRGPLSQNRGTKILDEIPGHEEDIYDDAEPENRGLLSESLNGSTIMRTNNNTSWTTGLTIYQLGVFISRSSLPFVRIHHLYPPSFLQCLNLFVLVLNSLYFFLPSVYVVFAIVLWEGLLGGLVYVNTFAEIGDQVPKEEREFALGATTVSDSGGIMVAGLIGLGVETWLCEWQVNRGRDWCTRL